MQVSISIKLSDFIVLSYSSMFVCLYYFYFHLFHSHIDNIYFIDIIIIVNHIYLKYVHISYVLYYPYFMSVSLTIEARWLYEYHIGIDSRM